MNNFTEVCKLSHFPLSANRLHQVNMKTHLPRTWGLQIVSLSFVGKPLAPSGHENTLASHLRSANCLTFLCRQTACTKWTWEHTCLVLCSFNLLPSYKAEMQLGPTSFYKEVRTHILHSATFSYNHSIQQVQSLFLPVTLRGESVHLLVSRKASTWQFYNYCITMCTGQWFKWKSLLSLVYHKTINLYSKM